MKKLSKAEEERLFAAARMIYNDGIGAIQSTSRLVGEDMALAMLMMSLVHTYNLNGTFPMTDETRDRVLSVIADL